MMLVRWAAAEEDVWVGTGYFSGGIGRVRDKRVGADMFRKRLRVLGMMLYGTIGVSSR